MSERGSGRIAQMMAGDLDAEALKLKVLRALQREFEDKPGRKGELHVSQFTKGKDTFCARAVVVYYLKGEDKGAPASLVYYDGKWRETKWKNLFDRAGLTLDYQKLLKVGPLTGTPDFLIKQNGTLRVIELTGADSSTPVLLARSRLAVKKRQCRFYLGMCRLLKVHEQFGLRPADKGFVVVEDKGSNRFDIHVVEHDQEKFEDLMRRVARVWLAIKTKKLPPKCGNDKCKVCWPKKEE